MSKVTKGARKSLIWLAVILVAIYALLAVGVATGKTTLTPGLALDLAGGRQIILTPVLDEGSEQEIEQTDLDQAVSIIRQRVDASGVAEAEITTQGDNIVIGLPGNPSDETIDLVAQAAQLQFRAVLIVGDPNPTGGTAEPTPAPSAGDDAEQLDSVESTPTPSPSASSVASVVTGTEPEPEPSPSGSAVVTDAEQPATEPTPAPTEATTTPDRETTDGSSFDWLTPEAMADFNALDCLDPENYAGRTMGDPNTGYSACALDPTGPAKLAMGPVEVTGDDLETASSGPRQNQAGSFTGDYEVRLTFNDAGAAKFDEVTTRLVNLEDPRNQFAIILDGTVISHPTVNQRISNGEASISGGFTQEQAEQLANQLRFGALPLSLEVQSNQQISATLGEDQLQKGLLAGAIGLVLVALYSLLQYRALGFVTISSLLIAGATTFGVISLLSWGLDYRLSIAGVAGVIVSIGITADSFIVYFERIRDELREGRSLASAVDHAWTRARRTILVSDAISLLAAVVLYILAVGGVRGFAFTLGLITVIDVLVVFLFTHPVMVLLAKTRFFGEGHPLSGLDPRQLGREALYKGRGRVRSTASAPSSDGLTLAERKAAAKRAAAGEPSPQDVTAVDDEADAVDAANSETKGDAR
ncbi:protein translocase subunit SecD [Demequina activiva]|uniref:Protein translocase subunit SecD n=1 Tax=Demequina activiva TaxID=1582364 RepID=A0A919ULE6_9MICO|nr:protein translocase subunit SecD [Demequina activiva]GIG54643.1 protein translocase subunit SecD [Demequina activiva]